MRFPKPPQLMTDEELTERVVASINQRLPESDSLDYKALLNIETRDERIELAKDASSFANEFGGTLLYGVPEEKEKGVPIPVPLAKCGLQLDGRFAERVENILLASVRPVLPNLFVKLVTIPSRDGKQIVIIQHPASWNKPHMVEGYIKSEDILGAAIIGLCGCQRSRWRQRTLLGGQPGFRRRSFFGWQSAEKYRRTAVNS